MGIKWVGKTYGKINKIKINIKNLFSGVPRWTIFNYDLISICETSLNDSIKLPDILLLNDYTFVPSKYPTKTRHGGVGLFFENSLPIKIRNDLSFEKLVVIEINVGRKNLHGAK